MGGTARQSAASGAGDETTSINIDRHHRRRPDGQRHRPCLRAVAGLDVRLQRHRGSARSRRGSPRSTATCAAGRQGHDQRRAARRRRSARIHAGQELRGPRHLRPRDRGRDRERGDQAPDLQDALPGPEARCDDRHQHLVDLDHAARRRDRPAGALHRHPLHESGAGDAARRADPRHRHRGPDLRSAPRASSPSSARRRRCRRISRPSSSTASCCR